MSITIGEAIEGMRIKEMERRIYKGFAKSMNRAMKKMMKKARKRARRQSK